MSESKIDIQSGDICIWPWGVFEVIVVYQKEIHLRNKITNDYFVRGPLWIKQEIDGEQMKIYREVPRASVEEAINEN